MIFMEMIDVHSESRTKHLNAFCGQNEELLMLK
jgi:hypothetical protein